MYFSKPKFICNLFWNESRSKRKQFPFFSLLKAKITRIFYIILMIIFSKWFFYAFKKHLNLLLLPFSDDTFKTIHASFYSFLFLHIIVILSSYLLLLLTCYTVYDLSINKSDTKIRNNINNFFLYVLLKHLFISIFS